MTVYEIFKQASKEKMAQHLCSAHSEYFKDKEKTIKKLKKWDREINKLKYPVFLNKDFNDFIILVSKHYDSMQDDIPYKEDGKIDYEALENYFCADGIHLSALIKYEDKLSQTLKDIKDDKNWDYNESLHTYGLDLTPRETLLSCHICDASIERFTLDVVAAEIFWEMTFYGFYNSDVSKEIESLTDTLEDSQININKSKFEDGTIDEEEFNKHFVSGDSLFSELNDEEVNEAKNYIKENEEAIFTIGEYNHKHFNDLMKRYLELSRPFIEEKVKETLEMPYFVSGKKYKEDITYDLKVAGYTSSQIEYVFNKYHFLNKYRFKEIEDYETHKKETFDIIVKENFTTIRENFER